MVQIKLITKELYYLAINTFILRFQCPHENLTLQKVNHLENNLNMLQSIKLHDHDSKHISQNYIT